jgi:DNA polymerase-3 subunit epsilon
MADRFVSIDVETANPDLASICQIGVVTFEGGKAVASWESLVDPEDYFDFWNVAIHGIDETDVAEAPVFPDLMSQINSLVTDEIVVCHTPFDRLAMSRAADKYSLPGFRCTWLDSARVVRRAWPQFAKSGYGLAVCTAELGIEFDHHVAVEDARAAGELIALAIDHTGLTLEEWLVRITQPLAGHFPSAEVARSGNPEGHLAGEVAVFTGALSITRSEAADLAAEAGCNVSKGVTNKTTLLIVGDQDIRRLAGHQKSSKHRKAEALIEQGQSIRILGETDFLRVLEKRE